MSDCSLVFDIGGTKTRLAAVADGVLEEPEVFETKRSPGAAMEVMGAAAKRLAKGRKITSAAGGLRGLIVDGTLFWDKVLTEWQNRNIAEHMSHALGAPTRIVNDTSCDGLGEAHYGAGRGAKIVAYITVSTGVGGTRIDNGAVDNVAFGFEIGHQLVNGVELEELVSGSAVRRKYKMDPKDLSSIDERNKLADTLALGLFNTTLHWSPDVFVLGGSMIVGQNPIPLDRVRDRLAQLLTMYPKAPAMVMAQLGDFGGLYGGMVLLGK